MTDGVSLVSNTAQVFEFCRGGNMNAVKLMLTNGEASVADINEFGETPLHVSNYELSETVSFVLTASDCRQS